MNIARNFKSLFSLPLKPFEAVADFLSLASTIGTYVGLGAVLSNPGSKTLFSIGSAPFAFRLGVFVLVAAALGWLLGALSSRLTLSRREHWHIVSYVLAVIMAATVVTVAELLADVSSDAGLPQVPLLSLIGVCLTILLCRFLFRSHIASNATTLHSRSICLVLFSSTCLVVLLLLELN